MSPVSRHIKALYTDVYADSGARDWRDTGAVAKADNVTGAWRTSRVRPVEPHVVELGSGEGALAAALSRRGFFASYRGFDISTSGVAEASARSVPGARFEVFDGDAVPVADRSADLVVLSHVVEHLEHPRVMLYEAARIAPYVFVEVPLELTKRAPKDYVVDSLGHINKYNSVVIRHLVQSCGFEVLVEQTTCPSIESLTFFEDSPKRRLAWQVKSKLLRLAPAVAKEISVYHGVLLLKSPAVGG